MKEGNWQVTRNCCTSGMCLVCRPSKQRPVRIIHMAGVSKEFAEKVAANWSRDGYVAKAVEMCPD